MSAERQLGSVLIVEDEVAERELLATILGCAGYLVVTAGTGERALRVAREQRPAVIVADILMPTMDGYELVRELRAQPDTAAIPVVFYATSYVLEEARELAAACGVSDILTRPYEAGEALRVVAGALARRPERPTPLPSEDFHRRHLRRLNARLLAKVEELRETVKLACALHREAAGSGDGDASQTGLESLSPREREVLTMIVDGSSNGDIAERLKIATSTVQSHVKRILHKLGVKNRTEAAVRYLRG